MRREVSEETAQTVHQRSKVTAHLGHSLAADLPLAWGARMMEWAEENR